MTFRNPSRRRAAALALLFVPGSLGVVSAQDEGTTPPAAGAEETILLRSFPRQDGVIRVLDRTTYQDRLSEVRMTQGEEVLLPLAQGENPFAVGRSIEIERQFVDRLTHVETPPEGSSRILGLSRRYAKLESTLRSREERTARGSREKRERSDLVGKGIRVNRTGETVTASLDRPPQQPGTPPPPEPPQEDLALLRLEAHLESVLPDREVATGESWKLADDAVRSLLGGTDGYPVLRAENLLRVDQGIPRSNDPVAAFLAKGRVEATATLASYDADSATVRVSIRVTLDGVNPYGASSPGGDAATDGDADPDAAPETPRDTWTWSGTLEASGTVTYARRQRYVTQAALDGKLAVEVVGKGPEGPAQIEMNAKSEGTLKREIRIFQDNAP